MHFCLFVVGEDPEGQLEPYYQGSYQLVRGRPILEIAEEAGVENLQGDILKQLKELTLDSWVGATAILAHDYQEGLLQDLAKAGIEHFVMLGEDHQFHALNRLINEGCKWDWFEIGGRWRNMLKAKPGAAGKHRPTELMKMPPTDNMGEAHRQVVERIVAQFNAETTERKQGYYDILPIGDIDWDGMVDQGYVNLHLAAYDRLQEIVAGREWEQWPTFHAANRTDKGDRYKEFDSLRAKYDKLPVIAELLVDKAINWRVITDPIYLLPREEFLEIIQLESWVPHSLLVNGQWYERDDTSNVTLKEWGALVKSQISKLPPDTRLTVVDCHF